MYRRRSGKNTQKNYTKKKKKLSMPLKPRWCLAHLKPDILECKVEWALGSITRSKASGGSKIPAELLQILKDGTVKVLHSICQQIRKTHQWPQNWRKSVFIPIPKKVNAKECSVYHTLALIS